MRHVGEDAVVERDRVGDELRQIGRHGARRRHPRELRELVDQALQRFDLADDRVGALVDERLRLRRRAGEMPPQPLGGQLNRRQRILDLVGQAPRHLAPRRDLLRADQRRHVVEHQHDALRARRCRRPARVATTARCSSCPSRAIAISCAVGSASGCGRRRQAALRDAAAGPRDRTTAQRRLPDDLTGRALSSRAAALLIVVIAPAASTETTPVVMRSRIVSM